MAEAIREAAGAAKTHFVEATQLATGLLGDAIAANLFLTGYAFQQGLIPLSAEAIERAIEINGTAVEFNKQAFRWGRRAALDLLTVANLAKPTVASQPVAATLDEIIARRVEFLTGYQNTAYAKRYEALVRRVQMVEAVKTPGRKGLAEAVARYYYKLVAYKDEYEVARLYVQRDFLKQLTMQYEGNYRLEFNLAPPWLAKRDPETGEPKKRTYGSWMLRVFKILARLKGLRGTSLDFFGYQNLRRLERQLSKDYERTVEELLAGLNQENHALAIQIASIPEHIRGYDRVKEDHLAKAKARETELLAAFRKPASDKVAA
jgi:indolepyruvate ferredoxin oxidoreductase